MENIKQQLVSGTVYLAIAKYSGVIINIIIVAVLARIISPTDFAIVAIISVISNFFVMFSDFGIAAAIVQNQSLDSKDINNIFSYCGYLGLILGVLFFWGAYPISSFYSNEKLIYLAQLLSIQILFSSLNIVPNALILKSKNFRFISIRTISIHILTGVIAIVCALYGVGVYSLLINPIGSSISLFIVNIIKTSSIRFVINPKFESLKKVLNYSISNLIYNVINYFSRNLDKLIIGKKLSIEQLAYYEKSYSLMMMPVQNIISVINPVIHPVLSDYQNSSSLIFKYFLKCTKLFAWIGFPISVLLYTYGHFAITIILGNQWINAIPTFKIFSLSIAFQLIYSLQGPFFLVMNAPKLMMYCGFVTMALNISALLIGIILYGNISVVAAMIDCSYVIALFFTFYVLIVKCFPEEKHRNLLKSIEMPFMVSLMYLGTTVICDNACVDPLNNVLQSIFSILLILITIKNVYLLLKK